MQKILKFIKSHRMLVGVLVVVLLIIVSTSIKKHNAPPTWVTGTIDEGPVSQVISVSGTIDATKAAELAFPVGGIIESIPVQEGDVVTKGTVLASLVQNDLRAEYQDAAAALQIAQANYNELVTGLRPEERNISKTKVEIAREDLARITRENNDRVTNAARTLYSSDLEARPTDKNTRHTAPVIAGSFTCTPGTYVINTYPSSARSGFSYRVTGLESGTYSGYTETSGPLGSCGLTIRFTEGERYGTSEWTITIPNTLGDSYTTNLNAYNLAVTERANAIREAEQNLRLAEQNAALDTADPRSEAQSRSQASVLQAQARLDKVGAQIQDRKIIAPFDGTITKIDPVPGETVSSNPVITMVSKDAFQLTALIPEIDITKLNVGQKAEVVFDARQSETLPASIIFISPLAREIDGVSYFEATLELDNPVDWLRSGLNADIHIIQEKRDRVVRIPKRFLVEKDGTYSALLPDGKQTKNVSIAVPFVGNDGFAQVEGLNVGDTVVAP